MSLSQHFEYYEEKTDPLKARRSVYESFLEKIDVQIETTFYPDDIDPKIKYSEGKSRQILVNSYERNVVARKKCIDHFGLNCQVCDFNFKQKFGNIGRSFIHVHHKVDLADIGEEYSVDPINDLIPVCPNCHASFTRKGQHILLMSLSYY